MAILCAFLMGNSQCVTAIDGVKKRPDLDIDLYLFEADGLTQIIDAGEPKVISYQDSKLRDWVAMELDALNRIDQYMTILEKACGKPVSP